MARKAEHMQTRSRRPSPNARRPSPWNAPPPEGPLKRLWEQVCALALEYPGVEAGESYRTPAIKVKGRFLARLRTEAEGALAIRCDFVDRQILLQAAPEVFFITDHYRAYPMILVRLDRIGRAELASLLERAWRFVAPAKLVEAFDSGRTSDEHSQSRRRRGRKPIR
jgi:hypothetical protein